MPHFILLHNHPELGERRFELIEQRVYRIGSRMDNDIVLPQKDVSRHHAVLKMQGKVFHITDLNSKNGTFVNGQRVAAAEFCCGDQIHLSSAALVVLEVSSGTFNAEAMNGQLDTPPPRSASGEHEAEDTLHYHGDATVEDMVDLLEQTAHASRTGALSELLNYAVERFGFDGIMVLYSDPAQHVAMAASAGDLGRLLGADVTLSRLVRDNCSQQRSQTVRHVSAEGEQVLLASLGSGYALLVRFGEDPPAVADMRALMAAVSAVLGSMGRAPGVRGAPSIGNPASSLPPAPQWEELMHLPLEEARRQVERWVIGRVLYDCGGNRTESARRLGLSRAGLFKKLRRLGIKPPDETPM